MSIKEELRVGVNVLIGTAFLEIIRQVLRQKHDLVIMAAKRRSGLKGRFTSLHLMRKCPCLVWVMKPTWRERFHRILAAVDPICTEEENNLLNIKIMDLAKRSISWLTKLGPHTRKSLTSLLRITY